jgi:hypothetical protein
MLWEQFERLIIQTVDTLLSPQPRSYPPFRICVSSRPFAVCVYIYVYPPPNSLSLSPPPFSLSLSLTHTHARARTHTVGAHARAYAVHTLCDHVV